MQAPASPPHLAVTVPCYNVEQQVAAVLRSLPGFVRTVVAVDDGSTDRTGAILDDLAAGDERLVVIHHDRNRGVGAATKTGYAEALRRGAAVVVKVDGDGQMDPRHIETLVEPILSGRAEYAKGNRFHQWDYLRAMPLVRKLGNLGLSFLIKLASGYWNLVDPTNGFTAISARTLAALDVDRLEDRYLLEISTLVELYLIAAPVEQVSMRAIYQGEASSLNVGRALVEFPLYLLRATVRRFVRRYVWQDFTAVSVFVILGLVSIAGGASFGAYHWIGSLRTHQPTLPGTVMLSAVPVILGCQLLLQAIVLDIGNVPRTVPATRRPTGASDPPGEAVESPAQDRPGES